MNFLLQASLPLKGEGKSGGEQILKKKGYIFKETMNFRKVVLNYYKIFIKTT